MGEVSFQRVASYYDQLASLAFGNTIRQAQLHYLQVIPKGSLVIIVGGGTGWILEDLILSGLCKKITFVETAPAMLRKARDVFAHTKGTSEVEVEFVLGSETTINDNTQFDVVLTFFLLDLYPTPKATEIVQRLSVNLKKEGLWLFADFDPKSRPQKLWQRILLWLMFRFFRLTTNLSNQALPEYSSIFSNSKLEHKHSTYFYHSFIRSAVYQKH